MIRQRTALLTGAALACVLATGFSTAAFAQCEYPLFLQKASVSANVVILFDNSGSMNIPVYHADYDPSVTYSGGLNSTGNYYVASDGYYSAASFRSGEPSTPTAPLVNSDSRDGRYEGNYLNWIFYHATDAQRAALPQVTRIQVAKPAVNQIIGNNPNVRFGLFRFNGDSGGTKLADLGTDTGALQTTVNNIVGDGWTPLAEAMVSVWSYLVNNMSAIEYGCQKTFLVVVTDGFPTQDRGPVGAVAGVNLFQDWDGDGNDPGDCASLGSPDPNSSNCSDWMDDVAYYMRHNDARGDLDGDQFVYTYTIGFSIDARILSDTADNGDGTYISAMNPTELNRSLEAVLRDIVNRVSSGSAVAVVSTEGQTQDLLFRGKFQPGAWRGYLEAFELPYTNGEAPYWEAGEILQARSAASRTMYTAVNGAQIDFTDSQAATLSPHLGTASDAEAATLINWTRGDEYAGMRQRGNWKLGDIVDSSPLVVGAPGGFRLDNDYLTWREALQGRERVIYIGSNDGMIRCFAEQTGEEKWAFIPESQLGNLYALADTGYCHQYRCNLTPKAFDAYVGGTWHTMLLVGMKNGGDGYVALDVTDPDSPQYMWEALLPDMSESWAYPEIVRVQSDNATYAFVGTGPDDVFGRAYLKAFDLADGQETYSQLLSDNAGTDINMSTGARAVDMDFDGWHDLVYVSDLMGNVWRLDLNQTPWDLSALFDTGGQTIQAQPIITVDYNNDVFLYFGTGRYLVNADLTDASLNTFYSVIDKHDGTTATKSDLVDETTSITQVGPDDRGWFIDLVQQSGERVVEPDALVAGIVYFTSFAPDLAPCSAGGHSWLYKVDFRNGSGDDGDDDDSNDTTDGRVEDLGDGVATKPVVDIANEEVIIQGSDTRIHVRDAAGEIRWVTVRSWRQRYN